MAANDNTPTPAVSAAAQPWTERMQMIPIQDGKSSTDSGSGNLEFNIASFNVLAESYLTPRSHPGLPPHYAAVAFDPEKRQQLLLETLRRFCCPPNNNNDSSIETTTTAKRWEQTTKWDILCLQELEILPEDRDLLLPAFDSWGYQVVRTPNDQRVDGSAIVFDKKKFRLVDSKVVRFDDLADLKSLSFADSASNLDECNGTNNANGIDSQAVEDASSSSSLPPSPNRKGKRKKKSKNSNTSPTELTGMVRSFLRRNCAIVAQLESIDYTSNISNNNAPQQLIVASAHLYWHPGYEYVKLCQTKYLLERIYSMAMDNNNRIPVVVCGDMNSKPGSIVHQLFVKPSVDARQVAPWHYFYDRENEIMYKEEEGDMDSRNDRSDGQDPIVVTDGNASPSNEGDVSGKESSIDSNHLTDSKKPTLPSSSGPVNGLSADFSAFCTVIDSDQTSQPPQVMHLSDHDNGKGARSFGIDMNDVEATLASRRLGNHISPQDYQHSTPPMPVKYMLDYTLNRFTRWLRILGIDATLETEEEEKERTSGGRIAIFEHCKRGNRTLITTSYKLLLRKDCPPGAYLLDPKSTTHLEQALVRLLRTHGVELSPRVFLTRCVVCNGNIHRVLIDEEKRNVFIEHGAPDLVNSKEDMEVFRCDGCRQGYWWDDRPSSSASRVFVQATKLLRLCLRGGVRVKDEDSTDESKRKEVMGAFDFISVKQERQLESGFVETKDELSVIKWLREERLSNPFQLRSAYALPDGEGETLTFSNVTLEFVGLLDYVFYDDSSFDQVGQLCVPTSFREMNDDAIPRGHLIPSNKWPSDHLAVGARLRLKGSTSIKQNSLNIDTKASDTKSTSTNSAASTVTMPTQHPQRCACGCVPKIFSLFEMAELRKQAREKAKAEAAAKSKNQN